MSLKSLPQVSNLSPELERLEPRPSITAIDRWSPTLRIKNLQAKGATVIEIFDQIGKDPWTGEGIGPQDVAAMLADAKDVIVNMNSPGGNFFAGAAIYNLLAKHAGKVTVNVLGLAGSAASTIAMAGDEILMGPAAFIMIHNAQSVAVGDRHDMESAMETLASIDAAIRDVYVARTGKQANKVAQMMDDETWMNARDAIKEKFADGMIANEVVEDPSVDNYAHPMQARRLAEAIFADAGKTRSQRRELVTSMKNGPGPIDKNAPAADSGIDLIRDELRNLVADATPRAGDNPTPRAGGLSDSLARLGDHLPG
jgi:ATP-dependent Clp protease protease subunit